jgi:hypothetical protein
MRAMTAGETPRPAMKRGWKLCGMVSPNMAKKVAMKMAQKILAFLRSKQESPDTLHESEV